ncbi:hypothetical protein P170DRAFT_437153 [Aspergillus steynii IBT 23096]|uniref:gamma-glutamylcyclotransferase n=1 Tax=Aspergillus steynii IBT 23096 TaxID=1392250 RepID=A0A2I2G9L5_9EURO|nr:uncharacterized protein P170DRAFT_437153 [Aspergillus steynii IBT 23096]PLB49577.1 hypothetical protein P170DRAFT_437153 [Aspergillus steynii IBT 23096]
MHEQDPSSTGTTTAAASPTTAITITTDADTTPARALYFAYGSNLSFTQMRMRCTHNPDLSSRPVAIARLDRWRWLICQPGYANVVPPAGLRVGRQIDEGSKVPVSGEEDTVYGVLYEMDAADEALLDGYEGVDRRAPPSWQDGKVPRGVRPREQADGDYNKWYVSATVTEWLDEEQRRRWENGSETTTVLVYVDEERVRVAPPRAEYIPRMNRAMREAETIGFPKKWTDEVMRQFIPPN